MEFGLQWKHDITVKAHFISGLLNPSRRKALNFIVMMLPGSGKKNINSAMKK